MALTPPQEAIYPKKHFQQIRVLYDGTVTGTEFSIAEITLHSGQKVLGIRHDRNEWNENTEENGYPVVRGGRPSWFVLPNHKDLVSELAKVVNPLK